MIKVIESSKIWFGHVARREKMLMERNQPLAGPRRRLGIMLKRILEE
jgi:hypothetical protein